MGKNIGNNSDQMGVCVDSIDDITEDLTVGANIKCAALKVGTGIEDGTYPIKADTNGQIDSITFTDGAITSIHLYVEV